MVNGLVSGNDGPMTLGRLALARGTLDRVAHLRTDTRWLAQAWADPRTRVLIVEDGRALVRFCGGDGSSGGAGEAGGDESSAGADAGSGEGNPEGAGTAELVLLSPAEAPASPAEAPASSAEALASSAEALASSAEALASSAEAPASSAEAPDGARILLGVDADGIAYFAVLGPLPDPGSLSGPGQDSATGSVRSGSVRSGALRSGVVLSGLRQAGALLGDRDAGLFTHAVALANWHATHKHCPTCGARTRLATAGHTRVCPRDGSEHFPRVDPAVIMLVLDSAGRCLLARNQKWPQKRVSILAGFVEPGESVEQAVAREVREEVGVSVADFRYLGSQPWPMPQSLMLGFSARAIADEHSDQSIRVDDNEIAEAHWYSRDELRAAIEAGDIRLPPPVSIAHRIIEAWFGAPLPRAW